MLNSQLFPSPLELLSPAGNWECARAAVANGADAIYFGLQSFNARLRAENFTDDDLPHLMSFLHQHGVRGFAAMNTLIFTSELEAAEEQLRRLEAARVDAIIVQDLGLVEMAHRVAPGLEIHASTQMTITSPEGLAFVADELGLDRAVLAREISLRELEKFRATDAGRVPLEVFVHGALCVAYSGQCLTSEALGQRSANRGECAQACRMPYQLVVDGETRDLGDQRYLLSPQDLAAIEEIPDLIRLGVRSFKIEGRLKTPEYVAAVTRAYRGAIDRAQPRGVAILATSPRGVGFQPTRQATSPRGVGFQPTCVDPNLAANPPLSALHHTGGRNGHTTPARGVGLQPTSLKHSAKPTPTERHHTSGQDGHTTAGFQPTRLSGESPPDCSSAPAQTGDDPEETGRQDGDPTRGVGFQPTSLNHSTKPTPTELHHTGGQDGHSTPACGVGFQPTSQLPSTASVPTGLHSDTLHSDTRGQDGHTTVDFQPSNETAGTKPSLSDPHHTRGQDGHTTDTASRYALEMAFSRGLSSGWLHGVNHQQLVHARYGKKRGAFLGTVTRTGPTYVEAQLAGPVAAGDGVVFENPADTDREMGGRVLMIEGQRLFFDRRANVDPSRVAAGTRIFKTDDPRLNAELRQTWASVGTRPGRVPLRVRASGHVGAPLRLEAMADFPTGTKSLALESSLRLEPARTRPLTRETLEAQFARLGGTPFHLAELEFAVDDGVMLPLAELNRIRREIVERLIREKGFRVQERQGGTVLPACPRFARPTHEHPEDSLEGLSPLPPARSSLAPFGSTFSDSGASHSPAPLPEGSTAQSQDSQTETSHVSVLCRSLEQVEVALECGVETIYVDFEDIRRGKEAVGLVRKQGTLPGAGAERRQPKATQHRVLLATPRIQKAGEEGFFKLLERAEPDGVLIRNLGAIRYFAECPHLAKVGDFSLNVANPLTAEFLMRHRFERLTISYDLNAAQVLDLLRAAPPAWFELTLHQHMPMFHMEHCVFAAFMSNGTDSTNCGRPCEKHSVQLRDRVGQLHPLLADVGCRNTLYRGQAQSGARFFPELRAAGLSHFRIELLRENAAATRRVITAYQRLLADDDSGPGLWQELGAMSRLGVVEAR